MSKYFGTDGVRGIANTELTPELAFRLGRVGAHFLGKDKERPKIILGRDTRLSGKMLAYAFISGALSTGADVIDLGVVSTPAVAYLTKMLHADVGAILSASHNPYQDNGIKLFNHEGFKLDQQVESKLEQLLDSDDTYPRPVGKNIGQVSNDSGELEKYLNHIKSTVDIDFCGMHIIVDCANGSASEIAPRLLRSMGADITAINAQPDGININMQCGSTSPQRLQEEVLKKQADLGLAFDGDADRLIVVDENGGLVDGDQIMYVCACYLKEKKLLKNNTLTMTTMSNLGIIKSLQHENITVETTDVGDRHVLENMIKGNFNLGGEQSGHIIFLPHNTTGDGLLTAIQLLSIIKEKGRTVLELSRDMVRFPQVLVNVPVMDKRAWLHNERIQNSIKIARQLLPEGRILVRASGTEPIIRVMVEGEEKLIVDKLTHDIADVIKKELGRV